MPPPPRESQIGECARAPCRCDCDTGSLSRPLTWPKQAGDSWANAARQGGQARAQRAPAVRRVSESRPRPPTKFVPRLRAGKGSDVSVPAEKKSRGPPHQAPAPTTTPLKPSLAALALPSKGPCNVSLSNLALKARWKRSSLGREHLRRQDRDDHSRLIVRSRLLFCCHRSVIRRRTSRTKRTGIPATTDQITILQRTWAPEIGLDTGCLWSSRPLPLWMRVVLHSFLYEKCECILGFVQFPQVDVGWVWWPSSALPHVAWTRVPWFVTPTPPPCL